MIYYISDSVYIEAALIKDEAAAGAAVPDAGRIADEVLSPLPPVVLGGALVVPRGLLRQCQGIEPAVLMADTQAAAARAREIVMAVERQLGFDPVDREFDRLGYDIESRILE